MDNQDKIKDKRLFYKLNLAQRLLTRYVDREINQRLGISVVQSAALFYLMNNDGCLFKDLSNVLLQTKSAITTLVERMKKNGLIVIKKSNNDKRASNIYLTDKGREIGNMAKPMTSELNQKLTENFSNEEVEIIHRFLDNIIDGYK